MDVKAVLTLPISTEYEGNRTPHISVVVPVVKRFDDLDRLYDDFSKAISEVSDNFEFVFVVEPSQFAALASLRRLMTRDPRVRLFRFNSCFGEAAALAASGPTLNSQLSRSPPKPCSSTTVFPPSP